VIAPEYQQELLRPSSSHSSPKLYVAAVAKANSGNAPGGKHRWDPPLRFSRRGRRHRSAAAAPQLPGARWPHL